MSSGTICLLFVLTGSLFMVEGLSTNQPSKLLSLLTKKSTDEETTKSFQSTPPITSSSLTTTSSPTTKISNSNKFVETWLKRSKRQDTSINRRSLCPWTLTADVQSNRIPNVIYQANCDMSSRGIYSCEYVKTTMLVLINTNNQWTQSLKTVNTACVAAIPITSSPVYAGTIV